MRAGGVIVAAALVATVAGCSRGEDPTAVPAGDQRQLNEAAEMLDANSVALEDAPTGNTGDDTTANDSGATR